MVNFKEIYHFSRFQRESNFFQGGSNCLFPIETHMTCDFPGGGGVRTPCPPSGSALETITLEIDKCKSNRRMAENGFAPPPPPREFCKHIISCRELKAESLKKCLHSVRWGVSL